MSLETIRAYNPQTTIYTTDSEEFKAFGRKLAISDHELFERCAVLDLPYDRKASYQTDYPSLHSSSAVSTIKHTVFGEMPIQVGIVAGQNDTLTGIEFHQGSEVNFALTDCILMLASASEMNGNTIDGAQTKKFYIRKGEFIEIYSTTLHYTPLQCDAHGFALGVVLLSGTNTELDDQPDGMLIKKNKWYICHKTQQAKIDAGCIAGLLGELQKIRYR